MRKKVRQSDKGIWWQGKVRLTGRPLGLKELPNTAILEKIAAKSREIVVLKVASKFVPKVVVAEMTPAEVSSGVEDVSVVETVVAAAGQEQATLSVAALRSSWNRRVRSRERVVSPAPDWV